MKKCIIVECENMVTDTRWPGCSKSHTWLAKERANTMIQAFSANKSRLDLEWYNQCVERDPNANWAKPPRLDFTVEEAKAYGQFVK